jgi:hypothetical protein
MWNDIQLDGIGRYRVNGKAHAIDADRALARGIAGEIAGYFDLQAERPGILAQRADLADTVDVATDQVPAERFAERKRRLQIDLVARRPCAV